MAAAMIALRHRRTRDSYNQLRVRQLPTNKLSVRRVYNQSMLILVLRSILHLSAYLYVPLRTVYIPRFMVAVFVDGPLSTLQEHVRVVALRMQPEQVSSALPTL
jgi:hypothetical protein